MAVRQLTQQSFEEFALSDPERQWEMHRGELREKPGMSFEHNDVMFSLGFFLQLQLDRSVYRLRVNAGHIRHRHDSYYIPDVAVIPVALGEQLRGRPDMLESYGQPLPFVAEVWSPSTGDYDVDSKVPEYQGRGDLEIWRIHPYERTLIAWRRQPDGKYTKTAYSGGTVEVASLPGVTIDLDRLFDLS
jgi:Uma2 family endonuclease